MSVKLILFLCFTIIAATAALRTVVDESDVVDCFEDEWFDENGGLCRQCSTCFEGLYAREKCSETKNTICGWCGSRNAVKNEDYYKNCLVFTPYSEVRRRMGELSEEEVEQMILNEDPVGGRFPKRILRRPLPLPDMENLRMMEEEAAAEDAEEDMTQLTLEKRIGIEMGVEETQDSVVEVRQDQMDADRFEEEGELIQTAMEEPEDVDETFSVQNNDAESEWARVFEETENNFYLRYEDSSEEQLTSEELDEQIMYFIEQEKARGKERLGIIVQEPIMDLSERTVLSDSSSSESSESSQSSSESSQSSSESSASSSESSPSSSQSESGSSSDSSSSSDESDFMKPFVFRPQTSSEEEAFLKRVHKNGNIFSNNYELATDSEEAENFDDDNQTLLLVCELFVLILALWVLLIFIRWRLQVSGRTRYSYYNTVAREMTPEQQEFVIRCAGNAQKVNEGYENFAYI